MKIRSVGIVGAGTMGSGIAQLCAERGFPAMIYDAAPDAVARAEKRIAESFAHATAKGKLTQAQAERARALISSAKALAELKDADLVIEAASEDLRLKQRIFKALGKISSETILATNTSSLPVSALAHAAAHPARVLGLHFFNPPVVMKLVEVAKTTQTQEPYFRAAWEFAVALGKTPVEVKDTPGFIVNRVMRPYYLRALRLANEGAGLLNVDKAAREIGGVPMGPFELMDLIGLDVNLSITKVIYEAHGSPERLRPSTIQEWLVNSGNTGRKAGKGFYLYKEPGVVRENPEVLAILPEPVPIQAEAIWSRIAAGISEEAQLAYEEGVASKESIDTAIKLATNFPHGPFEWQNAAQNASKKA